MVDADRIAKAIEYTRVPYAPLSANDDLNEEEGLLLRAADLVGQLGDPNYMRKATALFHEFEEVGMNKNFGYETPADIVYRYPQFYWNTVAPQIQTAIRYLNVTSSGRQWIWLEQSRVGTSVRRARCQSIGDSNRKSICDADTMRSDWHSNKDDHAKSTSPHG